MLAIARALMGNPSCCCWTSRAKAWRRSWSGASARCLQQLRDIGSTILIAEQNMHFCLGIASDAAVIDKGQIVYRDTIGGLKANKEVRSRYLAM